MTEPHAERFYPIEPSPMYRVQGPPAYGTWILAYEAPGFGDTIDLYPLIYSLLQDPAQWNVLVRTNFPEIPFQLISERVSVEPYHLHPSMPHPDGVRINIAECLRYSIHCPAWLRYMVFAGRKGVWVHREPFPLLRMDTAKIFADRGLAAPERWILQHRWNSRVAFHGRNTDVSNLERCAGALEEAGFTVVEIGNDAPPSGRRPYLKELTCAELLAVTRDCAGFAGIDSFPMHCAALYHKAILAFSGSTTPWSTLPLFRSVVAARHEDLDCLNCLCANKPYELNKCRRGIEVCGHPLPADYLGLKCEEFISLLGGNCSLEQNFPDWLTLLIGIGKSEFELQKALELCLQVPECRAAGSARMEEACSPNFHGS